MIIEFCVPSEIDAGYPQRAATLLANEITGLDTVGNRPLPWQALRNSERDVAILELDPVVDMLDDDDAVVDDRTYIVRASHPDVPIAYRLRSALYISPLAGTAAVWQREPHRPCIHGPRSVTATDETVLVVPKGSPRLWRIRYRYLPIRPSCRDRYRRGAHRVPPIATMPPGGRAPGGTWVNGQAPSRVGPLEEHRERDR